MVLVGRPSRGALQVVASSAEDKVKSLDRKSRSVDLAVEQACTLQPARPIMTVCALAAELGLCYGYLAVILDPHDSLTAVKCLL